MSAETVEFLTDPNGRRMPMVLVKPLDRARHELVLELVNRAKTESRALAAFKARAMADLAAFLELSAEQYGVHIGGHKGNVTLTSFCGRYRVLRTFAERLAFDERLTVAKSLIDECVREWSADSRSEVRVLIEHAFQVDSEGKVNTERVLGLRRLDIDDPRWVRAMAAIGDSITVAGSKCYVRFYERDASSDPWRAVSLDLASLNGVDK